MSALENPAQAPAREEEIQNQIAESTNKAATKVKTAEEKAAAKAAAAAKAKAKRDAMTNYVPAEGEANADGLLISSNVPSGFDSDKHKPLKKTDFVEEHLFMEYKANDYEARAKKLREEAAQLKKLGSSEDRAKAKKLMTMQQRMQELARELAGDGSINLEEILGKNQLAALLGNGANNADQPAE